MSKSKQLYRIIVSIITGIVIILLSSPDTTLAQFSIVSTIPTDGATNVDTLATFEISFNSALDTSANYPEPGDFFIDLLLPEDSLMSAPDSISLSEDLKTVYLHNIHLLPDTKYVFGILAAKSQSGELLDIAKIITFTTGETLPSGSISGIVNYPAGNPRGALVGLFEEFLNGDIVAITVVNQSTGEYTIPYVKEGSYFPITAKDISGDGEPNFMDDDEPVGIYDPDSDTLPDSIFISAGEAVTGINMKLGQPELATAKQYKNTAENLINTQAVDALLVGVMSENITSTGTSLFWTYFFYSSTEDRAFIVFASNILTFAFEEDLGGDMTALPEQWIDSNLAIDTTNENGGMEYINTHAHVKIDATLLVFDLPGNQTALQKSLVHQKKIFGSKISFPRVQNNSAEAKAAWAITYRDTETNDELSLLVDAVTGELIRWTQPGLSTARSNLNAADQGAQTWAADAELIIVGPHSGGIDENGEAMMWFFGYYSAVKDSVTALFLFDGMIIDQRPSLGWEPPSKTPLPANWIDSDAAMDTAEANGGSQYRMENNDAMMTGEVSRNLMPNSNDRAVWLVRYYSNSSQDLKIYIDAETGEYIPQTEPPTNITASVRLQDANQEALVWAADAVLTGIGPAQPMAEDGTCTGWVYVYYSQVLGSSKVFYALAGGPISSETPGIMPPSIEALPENWIDSDSATTIAEANGGSAFRTQYPGAIMMGILSKNLLQNYGKPAKAVWRFGYNSTSGLNKTIFIFIDAVSGAYISKIDPVLSKARFNLEAAQYATQPLGSDAELVFVLNNVGNVTPNGESDAWLFTFYSASVDAFCSVQVMSGQVVFSWDSDGGSFSQDALPETWKNSDEAVAVADANGGADFRNSYPNAEVSGFVTKNFPDENYDVSPSTAVWFFQYRSTPSDTLLTIMLNAVTLEIIELIPTGQENNITSDVPQQFVLDQNYPNPFNSETIITYQLPHKSEVEITIYNLRGQKIATLLKDTQLAGYHQISWNGLDKSGQPLTSGIYFYRLHADGFIANRKLILVK